MPTIAAYLNWGRWIVQCPLCHCADAIAIGDAAWTCPNQPVTRQGRLIPYPGGCGTAYTVQWPGDPVGVTNATMVRAQQNQNWTPDETVADLVAENIANGLVSA